MSAFLAAQARNLNEKRMIINQTVQGIGDIQGDDTINNGFRIVDTSNNIVRSLVPGNNIQARVVDNKQILIDAMFKLTSTSDIIRIKEEDNGMKIDTTVLNGVLDSCIKQVYDKTSGNKVITIEQKGETLSIDASALNTVISSFISNTKSITNRINVVQSAMPQKRFIGMTVRFDDLTILSQWGVHILTANKHLKKPSDGVIQIVFPIPSPNCNYGVLLSLNADNKAGVIQYAKAEKSGVSVITYNLSEKLTAFSGCFTIEIITG